MHNLKDYKEAIVICPKLEAILKVINLSINGLKHFKVYIPVARILNVLEREKEIISAHQEKYKKIKETKGKT